VKEKQILTRETRKYGGPFKQGIDYPGLAPALFIHVVQGFRRYPLAGLLRPLGKEPDNIIFTKIGKLRRIFLNIEGGTGSSYP
jgi:hypothetical protein